MPTKDRTKQRASNRASYQRHLADRKQRMKDYRLRNKQLSQDVSDEELDRRALELMEKAA